jgi:exosortase A
MTARSNVAPVCADRVSHRTDGFPASDDAADIERATGSWGEACFVLCSCLALMLVLHHTTIATLLAAWSRDPFGHGYFIVPGVVALAWTRRTQLAGLTPRAAPSALLPLAALSLLWFVGRAGDINAIQQIAVLAMCVGLAWAVVGPAAMRVLAFPLGLLFFAAPVDDVLAPALQTTTASIVATMLHYSGVSAALDQHVISTASTRWDVTEACGGIHYVVAGLVVGYVYAGAVYRGWRNRAAFIMASALIPVAGNVLRVYTTVLAGEAGATAIVAGMLHYAYGLAVFAAMMTVLVVVCGRWRDDLNSAVAESWVRADRRLQRTTWRTGATVTLAMTLVGGSAVLANVVAPPVTQTTRSLDRRQVSAPWTEVDSRAMRLAPRLTVDSLGRGRAYTSGDSTVAFFTAAFPQAAVEFALTGTADVKEDTLIERAHSTRTVELPGRSLSVKETLLQSQRNTVRLWTWFEIEGRSTASARAAKLFLAKARLFRMCESCLQIGVATEEHDNVDTVRILSDFLAHLQTLAVQNCQRSPSM